MICPACQIIEEVQCDLLPFVLLLFGHAGYVRNVVVEFVELCDRPLWVPRAVIENERFQDISRELLPRPVGELGFVGRVPFMRVEVEIVPPDS